MSSAPPAQARPPRIEIRAGERQLLIEGKAVKLGARAFDILQALYQRRERVVTKHELLDLVWPGISVEENNLQVQISVLRKLLGPGTIATIPGRGYQFTGVRAVVGGSGTEGDSGAERVGTRASSATPTRAGNVPVELLPLIGRDDDLAAVGALVAAHRVVSIVGAAGIGKTVLAQAVAYAQGVMFEDGVWLIELAPLNDDALVASTVASSLGLQLGADATSQDLAERLRAARTLLVLDNAEHMLRPVAELVQALLGSAPGVRILVTAQEPLKIAAENVYRLDALRLPGESTITAARAAGAVALFEARARASDPRAVLTEHNVSTVIDICRQLDGLPLAIELAAARVPTLGIDGLHARLDERLRLLTAGRRLALRRHQTLRAALEWSHGLLTPDEQTVFRRLGVFVGGFDLERAQQVGAWGELDQWSVLDHLAALVDKSLVLAQPGELPRYRLLESGRAYALEKLQEAGETDAAMERHTQAMRALFEQADATHWHLPEDVHRDRYVADLDNLRAALDWAAGTGADPAALIALTGASWWIWFGAAALPEGQRRCSLAMSCIGATTSKPDAARLLLGYAMTAHPKASAVELEALERGLKLCRELGDRRGLYFGLAQAAFRYGKVGRIDDAWRAVEEAQALQSDDLPPGLPPRLLLSLAHLHAERGDHEAAAADKLAALRAYERLGDDRQIRISRDNLADMELARGNVQEAVRLGRMNAAALRCGPRVHQYQSAACFANLSAALTRAGELDEARQTAREALPLLQRRGSTHLHLDVFALLALKLGRAADAARALGRSRAVIGASGDAREINEQRAHDDALAGLREAFVPDDLERLFVEGAAMSDDQAARTAIEGPS